MSITRYSREVELEDLNNVHTFAVLCVPRGSRVLDLGAAEGAVARVLAARGCDVTAVERDPMGVQALVAAGVRTVHADLESLGDDQLPQGAFDVILLLDVLEHLVDPGALLARLRRWLGPSGRILLSVPNVAHAAVRLSLLRGRFPRTDVGLLDRTHLHFFDREQLDALLTGAGLSALEVLTVDRDLHETELPVDVSQLPVEVVEAATADPASRIYQFFVIARPGPAAVDGGGLRQALLERLRRIESGYRALEAYAAHTERERIALRDRLEDLGAQLQEATTDLLAARAARDTAEAGLGLLADAEADRAVLQAQLRERMTELKESRDTIAVLQRDIDVQRAFAERLAGSAQPGIARQPAEVASRDAAVPPAESAAALAAEVAEYRRLQYALAFRAVARVDGVLRRAPRLRHVLRAIARRLAGSRPA